MTSRFPSKKTALEYGIFLLRGKVDIKVEDLKKVEGDIVQFNDSLKAEVYELENFAGKKCMIATAPFRQNDFDLWLISPDGLAWRV